MKIVGIYVIFSQQTERYYVGQSLDVEKRIKAHFLHFSHYKHHNLKLINHIKKYGIADLNYWLVLTCKPKELNTFEKFFIQSFDSYKNGFNMNEGGEARPVKTRKPFTLCNANTNEIYKGRSIKEFCKLYHMSETNICAVLNGRQNHHLGWYNLTQQWKPTYFTVINPKNEIFTFWKLSEFAKLHNLDPTGLYNLCHKISETHYGWKRPDSIHAKSIAMKNAKKPGKPFKLKDSNGNIITGNNLNQFAKLNELTVQNLYAVIKGIKRSHKGYKKVCE